MKAHKYAISTGVIAFGILGGNFTFNAIQCKHSNDNTSNSIYASSNLADHVCLHEWCCHTSGLLVRASPWIMLAILCTVILHYVMMITHPVDEMDNIELSLNALSLGNEHNKSNHTATTADSSWFTELNKLDLLTAVNTSLPVTMDTTSKQIISPPKLELQGGGTLCHTTQWNDRQIQYNNSINHKHYYYYIIIILSCLLSVSVACNVVLIYWIT